MTPKEYLNQYRDKVLEIKVMEESIKELEDRATSVTASTDGDRVQSGGNGDKVGTIAVKIADLQKECYTKMAKALEVRSKIEDTISEVEDHKYKAVLHLRYIGMLRWDELADVMGYEVRQIYRMHGQALLKIKDIIETCQ